MSRHFIFFSFHLTFSILDNIYTNSFVFTKVQVYKKKHETVTGNQCFIVISFLMLRHQNNAVFNSAKRVCHFVNTR